ncbi:MAG: FAD-dependent oxidoreductase [Bilophila wadsworthia]
MRADAVCVTVGRVPHTDGLGLDAAGVKVDARGGIEADDFLETSVPGVYAIGDVIGPRRIMLAHMAVAEAHTAVHNILHPEDRKAQRYDVVPSAIFTAPEIGDVGLSKRKPSNRVRRENFGVQFRELSKAQAMGELAGLFKLVVEEGSGKLLGAHRRSPRFRSDRRSHPRHPAWLQPAISSKPSRPPTLSEGLYEAAGSLV